MRGTLAKARRFLAEAEETPTYSSESPQSTKSPPSSQTPRRLSSSSICIITETHKISCHLLHHFLLLSPKVYPRSKPLLSCTASRILKNVNSLIFQKGVDANIKTIILFIK
jgi:hypothetical protein